MGISAAAWIFFRRGTGFIAATLKSVPAVCAAMGLIAPFSVVGALRVIPPIPNFLTPIIAGILPVFCAGFLAHMFYARKCGFSFFKTLLSFAAGGSYFGCGCGCGVCGVAVGIVYDVGISRNSLRAEIRIAA